MNKREEKRALVTLGKRVTYFREEKGYNKTELSIEADLTREQVGRIEQGKTNPTYLTLSRIAIALDVSLLDLLNTSTPAK